MVLTMTYPPQATQSHWIAFMKSPLVFLLPLQSGSSLYGVRDTTGRS